MPTPYIPNQKVPATPANCKKDQARKKKLKEEFKDFESLVRREARKSRDVHELLVPLASLKNAIVWGAHGILLVPVPPKKKKKVLTARATPRAGRRK